MIGFPQADNRPDGFDDLCRILVSPKILGHSYKDVRLLASNCIVEVLRIYAPEAPYNSDELAKIFKILVSQLRGLGNITEVSKISIICILLIFFSFFF